MGSADGADKVEETILCGTNDADVLRRVDNFGRANPTSYLYQAALIVTADLMKDAGRKPVLPAMTPYGPWIRLRRREASTSGPPLGLMGRLGGAIVGHPGGERRPPPLSRHHHMRGFERTGGSSSYWKQVQAVQN